MKPVDGGRLCGECSKSIVDFSKMSWGEIEQVQRKSNNSVCGLYLPKQINNWGRQAPVTGGSRFMTTGAVLLSLTAATHSYSQNTAPSVSNKENVINGTVTGKTLDGKIDTLGFANISLKNTNCAVVADEKGNYQVDLTGCIATVQNPTLVFRMEGYEEFELQLTDETRSKNVDAQLTPQIVTTTTYYMLKPTLGQRIKWRLKRLFHLKGR